MANPYSYRYDPEEAARRFVNPESEQLKQLRALAMQRFDRVPQSASTGTTAYGQAVAGRQGALQAANAGRGGPAVGMTGGSNDIARIGAQGAVSDAQQRMRDTAMGGDIAGQGLDRNRMLENLRNRLRMQAVNRVNKLQDQYLWDPLMKAPGTIISALTGMPVSTGGASRLGGESASPAGDYSYLDTAGGSYA